MASAELWIAMEEAFVRLGVATVAGALIGVNRDLRGKPAGVRTHALVALGSALVTYGTVVFATRDAGTDADAVSRAIQGIVAGIGFLGGGVILKSGDRTTVYNLTTAASLWVVACLGVVAGAGQWVLVLAASMLTMLVLLAGGPLERSIRRLIVRWVPDVDEEDEDTGPKPRAPGSTTKR